MDLLCSEGMSDLVIWIYYGFYRLPTGETLPFVIQNHYKSLKVWHSTLPHCACIVDLLRFLHCFKHQALKWSALALDSLNIYLHQCTLTHCLFYLACSFEYLHMSGVKQRKWQWCRRAMLFGIIVLFGVRSIIRIS